MHFEESHTVCGLFLCWMHTRETLKRLAYVNIVCYTAGVNWFRLDFFSSGIDTFGVCGVLAAQLCLQSSRINSCLYLSPCSSRTGHMG